VRGWRIINILLIL